MAELDELVMELLKSCGVVETETRILLCTMAGAGVAAISDLLV